MCARRTATFLPMADLGPHEGAPALDRYRNMLRSTWPVILLIAALVTVVAVVVNGSRDKVYAASSDVYLTRFDIPGQLGGLSDFGLNQPAQRWIETQAGLARVPEVANGAIAIAKVPGATAASLLQFVVRDAAAKRRSVDIPRSRSSAGRRCQIG